MRISYWFSKNFHVNISIIMTENNEKYLKLLQKELKIAMGCTEPAAAALAGALSRDLLGVSPERIEVLTSRDMIKNVMGVGIPNSPFSGLDSAVLIGALYGDAKNGLNILSEVSEKTQQDIFVFKKEKRIRIVLVEDVPGVYIKVQAESGSDTASITIAGEHDHVVEQVKNGEILFREETTETIVSKDNVYPVDWSIQGIFNFIKEVNEEDCAFLLEAAKTNQAIAEHSINHFYGMSVGRVMYEDLKNGIVTLEDALKYGAILASAASDARMAGCSLPVVINSGSGNQGLTATIPPMVLARFLKKDNTTTVRALCLSHLVAIYLAYHKGRLSALCGAFTAAIGTSCAYIYLLGGNFQQVESVINIMVADLMGIICDGAKKTCALKIYSCIHSAAICAKLALKDCTVGEESGILGQDSDETISYLEKLSHEGMEVTDKTILSIMVGKKG